jgi:hypothetical protein
MNSYNSDFFHRWAKSLAIIIWELFIYENAFKYNRSNDTLKNVYPFYLVVLLKKLNHYWHFSHVNYLEFIFLNINKKEK